MDRKSRIAGVSGPIRTSTWVSPEVKRTTVAAVSPAGLEAPGDEGTEDDRDGGGSGSLGEHAVTRANRVARRRIRMFISALGGPFCSAQWWASRRLPVWWASGGPPVPGTRAWPGGS